MSAALSEDRPVLQGIETRYARANDSASGRKTAPFFRGLRQRKAAIGDLAASGRKTAPFFRGLRRCAGERFSAPRSEDRPVLQGIETNRTASS